MSVDKSLKLASGMARTRSVLSRVERLEQLKEGGKWDESKSIFGLPKVRVRRVKRKAKVAATPTAEAAAAAPAGTEAAPAGAKAGAPAAAGAAKAAPKAEAGKAAPKK